MNDHNDVVTSTTSPRLTIAEIARRLGRAHSTVTHWRDRLHDILDETTDERGRPLYRLDVFVMIDQWHREGRSQPDMRLELERQAGTVSSPDPVLAALQAILSELREIRRLLERPAP